MTYLNQFLSPDPIIPDYFKPQSLNHYSYALNNPVNFTDPSGLCPPSVPACRGEDGRPIDQYYRYGDRGDVVSLIGPDPWYPIEIEPKPILPERPGSNAYVFGLEYSVGLKKTIIGKGLQRFVDISNTPIPLSTVVGLELLRHRQSGRMNLYFLYSSSIDAGKGIGGGSYGSVYVGEVYNLEELDDYAHTVCLNEALDDLPNVIEAYKSIPDVVQTYNRFGGTVARGPYGATIKHATGVNNDIEVNTAGYSAGVGAQVSYQSVRVIPVGDTIHQLNRFLRISERIGTAIWNFNWQGGTLHDATNRQQHR